MDNIPSKSISKSLLIATPLFLIIMAILNTSNQISYLFVLDFVNNVGGKADIMFLPTSQPQIHTDDLYRDMILNTFNQGKGSNSTPAKFPIVNMTNIKEWAKSKDLVQGVSARWLIPILADSQVDSLIMVMNIGQQLKTGFGLQSNLQNLAIDQVSIPQQLADRLDLKVGQKITIDLGIKNLFNGMKLIEKFQDPTSKDQFTSQTPQIDLDTISSYIFQQLPPDSPFSKDQVKDIVKALYNVQLKRKYIVKNIYKQNGLFPSALHNVILMEYPSFASLMTQFLKENILENTELNISQFIPEQYRDYWNIALMTGAYEQEVADFLEEGLQEYCIISLLLFKKRQLIYHPDKPIFEQFTEVLEDSPSNVEVVALYPFYQQSLNIKYFFSSVIQIFEVITCVIYFYTMSLIMKQIYEEKQIEVGIWRTLGAGGVKQQLSDGKNFDPNSFVRNKLKSRLSLKQKLFYYYKVIVKIGFMYYWLFSAIISIFLYMIVKYFLIQSICNLLHFQQVPQNMRSALVLFLGVFFLCQFLSINHINNIYTAPLALTIKPIKRTFDEVKIRIIHLATFGVSSQVLLIALMLIYYGIVSYYWIPFSILDQDVDLQTTLFNSIFIFMIFGAIILISVVQSRFQRLILRVFFFFNERFRKMKIIMLKNIKAKQYKNIKMSIIIAVTFAFLLFFSTGINIEIMIVQSFIERTLGASLVLQNYEKKSFNKTLVDEYLTSIPNVKHSWLSADINSDGIDIDLINQMDPTRDIYCQFKVMTPNYLESSFYKYYYPQNYIEKDLPNYRVLDNGVYDGFDALYKYDQEVNNQSIGKFNPNDTMTNYDPYKINIGNQSQYMQELYNQMAPQEQVINFAASALLKIQLGAKVGDLYKMRIKGQNRRFRFNIRSEIVHSYKIGPGMDLLRPQAFITQQQAQYIYRILGHNQTIRYQKLLIDGPQQDLKAIGNKILAMSPQHTEMYEMKLVSQSFQLLQRYLQLYIVMISVIMGALAVLFIFLYTLGKCRDEAQMYKMLRAVGLPVSDIRLMIFLEILIRLLVSIMNGIALGIIFSLGFAMQIEQFLMLNTPGLDLSLIFKIAAVMFSVFCITVYLATKYLTKRTVSDTNKM